jgi:hypothetical protein
VKAPSFRSISADTVSRAFGLGVPVLKTAAFLGRIGACQTSKCELNTKLERLPLFSG